MSEILHASQLGSKRNEVARRRWKILARALQRSSEVDANTNNDDIISVRRFTSFDLITSVPLPLENDTAAAWFEYSTVISQEKYSIIIHHPTQSFTAADLMGFNNTGNICIWPSEEVLAYYSLCNLFSFSGKSVLELGGGNTCLAGLMIAKYSLAKNIHLTDGNIAAMNNVECIVNYNFHPKIDKIICSVLEWGNFRNKFRNISSKTYDIILSADCLFFDEARHDLVEAIWSLLNLNGIAFVMAPQRGNTFNKFEEEAKARGFICKRKEHYDDNVWNKHLKAKQNCDYDENIHYPLLLILTKTILNI